MVTTFGFIVLTVFVVQGYRKGFGSVLIDLIGLMTAYVCCYLWMLPLGNKLQSQWQLGMFSYIFSGAFLFGVIGFLFFIPSRLIRKKMKQREEVSEMYWFGGAMVGAVLGTGYAILAVWSAMFLRDLVIERIPPLDEKTFVERFSGYVMGQVIERVVARQDGHQELGPVAVKMAEDPGGVVDAANKMLQSRELNRFLQSDAFKSGQFEATQQFRRLEADPDLNAACRDMGFEGDRPVRSMIGQFEGVYHRAVAAQNRPEVRAILEQEDYMNMLRQRALMDVLRDPRTLELTRLVLSTEPQPPQSQPNFDWPIMADDQPPEPEPTIYKWRDDDGRLHISNQPPPLGAEIIE